MEDKNMPQHSSEEESSHDNGEGQLEESSSASSQPFAIGKRVPGCLIPTVEALVVARKVREDGILEVSLLLAPYMKKGSWVKAAVHVRIAQKIPKRVIERYTYPLPWATKLALEASRHKGEAEWLKNTLEDINHSYKEGIRSIALPDPEVVEEEKSKKKGLRRRKNSSSVDSVRSGKEGDSGAASQTIRRTSHRLSNFHDWSSDSSEGDEGGRTRGSHKQRELRKKKKKKKKRGIWPNSPRSRKAAAKAVRSSSSDSLDSLSDHEHTTDEVWESDQQDDGLVDCPFTSKDIRRFIDVKEAIKGKAVERRFIRQALHNLYRHYTSLQTFVDSLRARSLQGSAHPYPSELVWLEHHAIYIDCLLFESLRGMWGQWQEPILDLLVMSFLELVVRCSPRRQYPDKLEERVRRWMKKNRIGLSSSYGPIPFFLQNAKVSERGVVLNSGPYGRGRPNLPGGRQYDARGRGGGYAGFANRRGNAKPDSKSGPHE